MSGRVLAAAASLRALAAALRCSRLRGSEEVVGVWARGGDDSVGELGVVLGFFYSVGFGVGGFTGDRWVDEWHELAHGGCICG